MKIKYLLLSALLAGTVFSCDYLDVVPDKLGTIEYVFRNRNSAITYLATCYSYLPQLNDDASSIGRSMGNEATTYERSRTNGTKIVTDGNSVSNPLLNYWDGANGGKAMYRALHDCNEFLENVHLVRDLTDSERNRWIAEVKFLKAYYHWVLIENYGPIVLVKENLPMSATPEEVRQYRSPIHECIDYVIQLLNEAVEAPESVDGEETEPPLPLVVDDEITEYGRITRPIAAAMRAKIMVHAASPFYNGNTMYENFVDSKGTKLFLGTYDANKWVQAAEACKEAIEICDAAGYKLYEYDPEFIPAISDDMRLILSPSQIVTTRQNKETIWELTKLDSKKIQQNAMPALNADYRRAQMRGILTPTLATAERFYTQHGVPMEEDKEWQEKGWYDRRYRTSKPDKVQYLELDTTILVPYLNQHREPRFYGSLAFNGSRWFGAGYKVPEGKCAEDYQYTVKSLAGNVTTNPAGQNGDSYYSHTGYFSRKLVSYKTSIPNVGGAFTEEKYFWPVIRLADLYLLYAEALNESQEQPTPDIWENWIDPVRRRSGLKGVEESWTQYSVYPEKFREKSGLRDIIHQERSIELALEGHFYYDMRRWSGGGSTARYDIMTEMNKPIQGWNHEGTDDLSYNQVRTLYSVSFTLRDYLWPIKESNLYVNPNLVQNPGW